MRQLVGTAGSFETEGRGLGRRDRGQLGMRLLLALSVAAQELQLLIHHRKTFQFNSEIEYLIINSLDLHEVDKLSTTTGSHANNYETQYS